MAIGTVIAARVVPRYDVVDRKLVVNDAEAELVRHNMQRFLEINSVRELAFNHANQIAT
jgi:hypothetical protein